MSILSATVISISIIFIATTLGSSLVFFFKRNMSAKLSNMILGFASGIMISAGIFGLLLPAMDESTILYKDFAVVPVVVGFLLGGLLLNLLDIVIPHVHLSTNHEEGINTPNLAKQIKFFLAVAIHNIPEGLAVGFACGLALKSKDPTLALSALSLAIGIAIQNLPEGSAVSIPLFENKVSKKNSFLLGMASGAVEPIFALIGLALVSTSNYVMPWFLAFSAGAMIFVTIEELLPEARKDGHTHYGLWAFMVGFSIMLVLEVLL